MRGSNRRPDSLAEVSRRVAAGEQSFDPAVREFLDHFYSLPQERAASISARPTLLGALYDQYLAAVAEHLARSYGLEIPEWSDAHGERLRKPYFAGGLESLKARLTVESPMAFRRRMIFVSHNALDRPRM